MENNVKDSYIKRDYFKICQQCAKLIEKLNFNNILEELTFICKFISDSSILSTNEELPEDFEMPEDFKPGMLVMTGKSTEYHILSLTLDILKLRGYDVDSINVFMDFDGEYDPDNIDVSTIDANYTLGIIKHGGRVYVFDPVIQELLEMLEGPVIKSYINPESLIYIPKCNEEDIIKLEMYKNLVITNKELYYSEEEITSYINKVESLFSGVNLDRIINDIFNYENIMLALKKGADSNNRPKDIVEYKEIVENFLKAIDNSGILDKSKKYHKVVKNLGKALIEYRKLEEENNKETENKEIEVSTTINSFIEDIVEKYNIEKGSNKYSEIEALMDDISKFLIPNANEIKRLEITGYAELVEPCIKAIIEKGIINDIDAILNVELSVRKDIDKPTVYQLISDYYYRMRLYLGHVSRGTIEAGKRYVRKRELTTTSE